MYTGGKNFVSIGCPLCGATEYKKKFSVFHSKSNVLKIIGIEGENPLADIVDCNACGHSYMTPVLKDELLSRYYSVLNSEFYSGSHDAPVNINQKEYKDYTAKIKKLKPSGRILEIGCGNGFLLKGLESAGYECYGVEPSPVAQAHAKNVLGLNVENGFLDQTSFYQQQFDIVILIDVVEHITDMRTFMTQVKHVMADGAVIFIGTGNIDSLNAKIAGPDWGYFLSWEHVSFFNRKSMQQLLASNNFSEINICGTSLQHRPLQNIFEFGKNLFKKLVNPFLRSKYYHGITYDHFIVTAKYNRT